MPLTPGTSEAVDIDPVAHYSTTKPGVASQTLNPFIGIEAGATQTVPAGQGYTAVAATELPATLPTVLGGQGADVL